MNGYNSVRNPVSEYYFMDQLLISIIVSQKSEKKAILLSLFPKIDYNRK
ncbi:MAG: hypothetical protein RLZZ338_1642 [Cyanobacteriota bacterium]